MLSLLCSLAAWSGGGKESVGGGVPSIGFMEFHLIKFLKISLFFSSISVFELDEDEVHNEVDKVDEEVEQFKINYCVILVLIKFN